MSDLEKVLQQEPVGDFKEQVKRLAGKLKSFQREEMDWTETEAFREIQDALAIFFGTTPPIQFIESLLKHYKDAERQIEEHDLVEIMQKHGLEELTLDDGTSLRIGRRYSATIGEEEAFIEWFKAEGYGDHLKTVLEFRRGDLTPDVREYLDTKGLSYKESFARAGFPQTLGKIVRERIEAGESLPPENILKVSIMEKVVLK